MMDNKVLQKEKFTRGFTLAEILITLGVIGVISAMTIPLMMTKIQKIVLHQQFKKRFSVLQQAFVLGEESFGTKPNCWYWLSNPYGSAKCVARNAKGDCSKYQMPDGSNLPSDYNGTFGECKAWLNELKTVLRVIQDCEKNAYANGCIPAYTGIDDIKRKTNDKLTDYEVNQATSGCAGYRTANLRGNKRAWVLADGSIITFYGTSYFAIFLYDINGMSGPNKFGYDVVHLMTRSSGTDLLKLAGGGCESIEKGGTSAATRIKNLANKK